MFNLCPKTAKEWLAEYDAGNPVQSIEMGGIGPNYEMVIQYMTVSIMRACLNIPVPEPAAADEAWSAWDTAAQYALLPYRDGVMGSTGAQEMAAKSLAVQLLRYGPADFFNKLQAEDPARAKDVIMFSYHSPKELN